MQEFIMQQGTDEAFLYLAKYLNLSEMETALYMENPVVHHETYELVMALRRNRVVAIEMDQMVKQLEDQWHEVKKQEEREEEANWEDVDSEEEEEFTYVIGGYEISKEDLLNLLEIALRLKMMNRKRMATTIW